MGDMHFLLLTWLTAALIIWEVSWAAPRNAVADADSDNTGYITSPSTKNKPKKTDHDHSNPYDSSAVPQDDVQPPAEESGHNKPVEPITHSKSNKKPKAKKVPEKGNQCVLPPSFQKSLPGKTNGSFHCICRTTAYTPFRETNRKRVTEQTGNGLHV